VTARTCTLPGEDLIAYTDGYLTEGRRELVEAHLRACPHCRARVAAFDDVDRLLREGTPLTDDPNGRAMLRTRLERSGRNPSPRRLLAVPVLAALVILVMLLPGAVTEAGFPLGRFVTFGEIKVEELLPDEERRSVEHVAPSDPDGSTLPFRSVEPSALPHDFLLAERSTPKPGRLEVLYRDGDDLAILITQMLAEPDMVTIDGPAMETTRLGGTPVLIGAGIRPGTVGELFWEHDGVFFIVIVIESPIGRQNGLETADALEIVEALIAVQDAA